MRARRENRRRSSLIIVMAVILVMCSAIAVNASTITRIEELWETCSFGDVGVGHFEVDGKLAFCMEHAKTTPNTGTDVSQVVYDNAAVQKVLYYGYKGPAQWSGFTGEKNGIMVTSLMLSEVYTTAHAVGTYDEISGLAAFRTFLANQPSPDLNLKFNKTNIKAYYDKSIDAERTEVITVLGTGTGKLTVKIPEGYILCKTANAEEFRDSVVLVPGDKFYLRTEGAYSEHKTTDIKGRNAKLKPIVFVTSSTSLQDLTRLELAEDTAETTVLHVDWIGKINLRINKRDLDTGELVSGARFKLYEYDINGRLVNDRQITEYTIEKDGSILITERLQCGRRYVIKELEAPYCYRLNEESQNFEVRGDTDTITVNFANEKQYVYLIVNKTGDKHNEPLAGVKFEIMAANKILKWGTKEVLYYPGDTVCELITDEKGYASTPGLPIGKYTISEISTASGYVVDREAKTFDLRVEPNMKEFRYTVNLQNKSESTTDIIVKPDETTPTTPMTNDNNYIELYVAMGILALVMLALTLTIQRRCDRL